MTQAQADHLFTEDLYSIKPKVLVVLNHPYSILSEEDVVLLEKILMSVKLSLDSVQIIESPTLKAELIKNYNASAVLGFGIKTESINYYAPSKFEGTPTLLADSIQSLDDAKKKSLWIGLKQMFLNS